MIKLINVKKDNTSPDYAVHLVDEAIKECKAVNIDVIIVIHGYGSSGVGGVIKQNVVQFLAEQKKFKKIKDFVLGENFSDLHDTVKQMQHKYPSLILNKQLQSYNSGVTVVWVKDN